MSDLSDLSKKRENIRIVITRSPLDNGPRGKILQSTIAVMYGDRTVFSAPVQSTADSNNLGKGDYTLPAGIYEGIFKNKSGSYINPILIFSNDFFIHPDTITNPDMIKTRLEDDKTTNDYMGPFNPTGSKGCQIMETPAFNSMINILHTFGFKTNDTISVEIRDPYKPPKEIRLR